MTMSPQRPVLSTDRLLAVAADAARTTAGVDYLQPDIWGLVQQLGKELWQRVGGDADDTAGVELKQREGVLEIEISLVADDRRKIIDTVHDVQRRVIDAVRTQLEVELSAVSVNVLRVSLH